MNKITLGILARLLLFLVATSTYAEHAWGNYHWGRTATPFTLELGDNVSPEWDASLAGAALDWSISSVLDALVAPGKTRRNCKATDGRVEVCNASYGANGWLGIAQIWISDEHITKGVVKVNDTYFDTPTYDTPEWRALVMCQEIGHTLGLGHTDENFNNPPEGTCMDYSSDPIPNQHPNQHDYGMLESIYAHLDAVDTVFGSSDDDGGGNGNNGNGKGRGKPMATGSQTDLSDPSSWGQAVRFDAQGNRSLFVRTLPHGEKVVTFVTWVDGHTDEH